MQAFHFISFHFLSSDLFQRFSSVFIFQVSFSLPPTPSLITLRLIFKMSKYVLVLTIKFFIFNYFFIYLFISYSHFLFRFFHFYLSSLIIFLIFLFSFSFFDLLPRRLLFLPLISSLPV